MLFCGALGEGGAGNPLHGCEYEDADGVQARHERLEVVELQYSFHVVTSVG